LSAVAYPHGGAGSSPASSLADGTGTGGTLSRRIASTLDARTATEAAAQ